MFTGSAHASELKPSYNGLKMDPATVILLTNRQFIFKGYSDLNINFSIIFCCIC
jgi:hypothetical protein